MYEPTLETPPNTNFIHWGYNPHSSFIPATTNQANPPQTYAVIPNEEFETSWAGITAGRMYAASRESDGTPAASTLGVTMTDFLPDSFMSAPTCGIPCGLHCSLPMDSSAESIRAHLRSHGHRYPQRQTVQCPWIGCSDTLLWMNIPRHIQSIHLGIRFRCWNCGKLYTRPKGLERHITPLKCYGETRERSGR